MEAATTLEKLRYLTSRLDTKIESHKINAVCARDKTASVMQLIREELDDLYTRLNGHLESGINTKLAKISRLVKEVEIACLGKKR
jgi:hypothetical protein